MSQHEIRHSVFFNHSPEKILQSQKEIKVEKSALRTTQLSKSKIYPLLSNQASNIPKLRSGNLSPTDIVNTEHQANVNKQSKRRITDFEPKDEFEDGGGFQVPKRKPQGLKTIIQNGVQSAINVPGEAFKYILNGGVKEDQQKQKILQQKTQSFLAKLSDEQFKHDHFILFRLYWIAFYVQNVVMPIIQLIGTLLCLVSLFTWQAYTEGNLNGYYQYLLLFDALIGAIFTIEWLFNMYVSPEHVIVSFFEIENLMDALMIFQILWRLLECQAYKAFVFFNLLRALRISKLRLFTNMVTQNFKRFVLKVKNNELMHVSEGIDYDDESLQLNKFVFDSLILFTSGIIIESSYFLAFNEYMDFRGFSPYNQFNTPTTSPNIMSYMQAIYFTIVSFSTIGYGDIYPCLWQTRLSTSFVLLMNISVMSNFLGKFIEFLFQMSPYIQNYDYIDHVVIIGRIGSDQLKDFLDELVQNDKVQNKLIYLNEYKTGIKVIVVMDQEPNDILRYLAIYYTEQFGNEVSFLKEGIFNTGKKWYHQTNLKEAKILFAFSWFNDDGDAFENDKLISLAVTGVRDLHPNLRIMLVLNTTFKDQLDKDSLYAGIQSISPYQLNQYIMASSLENPGIGTILQHLLTMKSKDISEQLLKSCQHDHFMLSYIANMQQEIYSMTIPDFLIDMSFVECAKMLYLYGLELTNHTIKSAQFIQDHISDDRKMTLIAVETQTQTKSQSDDPENSPSQSFFDKNQVSIFPMNDEEENGNLNLLIQELIQKVQNSKKSNDIFVQSETKIIEPKTQILINPQNYLLKKGDVIYVICVDLEVAMEIKDFKNRESSKFVQFVINQQSMTKSLDQRAQQDDIIKDMYRLMTVSQNQYDQTSCDSWKREIGENDSFPDAFDFLDQQFPQGVLRDHYIVFGRIDGFVNVMQILRKYTDRPAILYCEDALEQFKWKELREMHKNIFFIRGEYLNLDDLAKIELMSAYQILIMSELMIGTLPDAVGICLARILIDHYHRNDFIIELNDETKISFLNKNPRLKNTECPNFFYPSFASGTIHFSSMITAILAKIVYSPNWLRFFEDLTIQKTSVGKNAPNKTVHCLRITKEAANTFKFYGLLQIALLEQKPSIISIGMVKQTFGSKFHENLIDEFLTDDFIQKLEQIFEDIDLFDKGDSSSENDQMSTQPEKQHSMKEIKNQVHSILQKVLGDRFILTNPSFYTLLEENDGIIVLGDLNTLRHSSMIPQQDNIESNIESILFNYGKAKTQSSGSPSPQHVSNPEQKNIDKLKQIKSFSKASLRISLKNNLIQELKRKYQGSSQFFLQYNSLL